MAEEKLIEQTTEVKKDLFGNPKEEKTTTTEKKEGVFGDREELLKEAWNRIRSDSSYVPRIYVSEEFGGTSLFYVSDVPFEDLNFVKPVNGSQPLPTLSAAALGETPTVVVIGGSMLSALYWITQRKRQVALDELHELDKKERS